MAFVEHCTGEDNPGGKRSPSERASAEESRRPPTFGAEPGRIPSETLTRGRCLYCEERCEANAFWHEYCREDHESEWHSLEIDRFGHRA